MDLDTFRTYCLQKKGTTEELPFGPDTLVFKVMGKMFATLGLDEAPLRTNLKCDPDRSMDLRERHPEIYGAYHMNKKHWNSVVLESDLDDNLIHELVDHSYALVVAGLSKKVKAELDQLP